MVVIQRNRPLIPGYLTRDANRAELASLGALTYEPLWIFYNPGAFDGPAIGGRGSPTG